MPRLAVQQKGYLEDQLQAFVDGRRKNKFMFDVAKVLSPAMRTALAAHFEKLNPNTNWRYAKMVGPCWKEIL